MPDSQTAKTGGGGGGPAWGQKIVQTHESKVEAMLSAILSELRDIKRLMSEG